VADVDGRVNDNVLVVTVTFLNERAQMLNGRIDYNTLNTEEYIPIATIMLVSTESTELS
jgi:hypothetical protein